MAVSAFQVGKILHLPRLPADPVLPSHEVNIDIFAVVFQMKPGNDLLLIIFRKFCLRGVSGDLVIG